MRQKNVMVKKVVVVDNMFKPHTNTAVTKNRMQPHAPHAPHATILGSMGSKNFAACSDSEKVLYYAKIKKSPFF